MSGILVSLSGGIDSATLLSQAVHAFGHAPVHATAFVYGSKHNRYETEAARAIAKHYSVPFRLIDLTAVFAEFRSDLLLSGGEIPEGHYEAESMRRTVVPARNLIFASVLLGLAQSLDLHSVWLGVHAGDHAIYPDCRPEFIRSAREAGELATEQPGNRGVSLLAPFLHMTKKDILKYGLRNGVPYHLTRTCYKDQPVACGRCGSCQERLQAFLDIGVVDPIAYESRDILPK